LLHLYLMNLYDFIDMSEFELTQFIVALY